MGVRARRRGREMFGAGGSATRYQMREKLIAFGDDYSIEDSGGTQLCRLQTRVLHVRDTMALERPDGQVMATVHEAMPTPLRERWKVDVADGPDLSVQGNVVDHEYKIEADGHQVAEVSQQWFRLRDTYGVQVSPEADRLVVLAVAVALDVMTHPG